MFILARGAAGGIGGVLVVARADDDVLSCRISAFNAYKIKNVHMMCTIATIANELVMRYSKTTAYQQQFYIIISYILLTPISSFFLSSTDFTAFNFSSRALTM